MCFQFSFDSISSLLRIFFLLIIKCLLPYMVALAWSYNKRLEKFYLDVICSTMDGT